MRNGAKAPLKLCLSVDKTVFFVYNNYHEVTAEM